MSKRNAIRSLVGLGVFLGGFLALSLVASPRAEAQSVTATNPCPAFSIQQVFADPNGDWDGDGMSNWDELYGGRRPCEPDNPLQPPLPPCSLGYWSWALVNADPNGDWDRDGITNLVEARNGANPCAPPCPYWSQADLAIDPNGDWDRDRASNAVEVHRGTNPCSATIEPVYNYNPCPFWSQLDVDRMPNLDWDGDGRTNRYEASRGFNPCGRTVVVPVAPVVVVVVPPAVIIEVPPPGWRCPAGYPYYSSRTGLCYSRPYVP